MRRLIVHETDNHGCGYVHFDGRGFPYSYDDEYGNIGEAVKGLIALGFIKEEDVIFLYDDEIYAFLDEALIDK
jgi:hypothetical protein